MVADFKFRKVVLSLNATPNILRVSMSVKKCFCLVFRAKRNGDVPMDMNRRTSLSSTIFYSIRRHQLIVLLSKFQSNKKNIENNYQDLFSGSINRNITRKILALFYTLLIKNILLANQSFWNNQLRISNTEPSLSKKWALTIRVTDTRTTPKPNVYMKMEFHYFASFLYSFS